MVIMKVQLIIGIIALWLYTSPLATTRIVHQQSQQSSQGQNAGTNVSAKVLPYLQVAQNYESKGEYRKALDSYTAGIVANPNEMVSYALRGQLYLVRLSDWNAAIQDFTMVLSYKKKLPQIVSKMLPQILYYRGLCYLNTQNLQLSASDLNQSLKYDSTNASACFNLGIVYALSGRLQDGEYMVTLAIKRESKNSLFYRERGSIRQNLLKYEDALADYSQALALNSNDQLAYANRAKLKMDMNKFAEAIADFTFLIDNTDYQVNNYFNRAVAYQKIKDYSASNNDIAVILARNPQDHKARLLKCINYFETQQFADGITECTTLLKNNPQELYAFSNILGEVNALELQKKFVNGQTYMVRGLNRLFQGDTSGAKNDLLKAANLGVMDGSTTIAQLQSLGSKELFIPSSEFPDNLHFFPRSESNSAIVSLSGTLNMKDTKYDSVFCELYRDNLLIKRIPQYLSYFNNEANISFRQEIQAGLYQYKFRLILKKDNQDTVICVRDSIVCGDTFLVSGQSNSVLGTLEKQSESPFIRTFLMGSKDSFWWQAVAGNQEANIGALGLTLASELVRKNHVPICILNSGISGSVIEQHFADSNNPFNSQTWYGRMLWHAKQSNLAQHAKALIWYQGESNQGIGYDNKFHQLYRTWKKDYISLKKIYVLQIRPSNCVTAPLHNVLREQQRMFSRTYSDVEVVSTIATPFYDGCHYDNAGYQHLGRQVSNVVNRDFYRHNDTLGISSPNLVRAYWTNSNRNEIALQFQTNDSLILGSDTIIADKSRSLRRDAFLVDNQPLVINQISVYQNNTIVLTFANKVNQIKTISYIPDRCYADSPWGNCFLYEGPCITTRRGVGVLTFHNVLINDTP